MRNITFSANDDLIDQARILAGQQGRTLNDAFREWLAQFTQSCSDLRAFDELMERITYVNAGRHFTRDEMNER